MKKTCVSAMVVFLVLCFTGTGYSYPTYSCLQSEKKEFNTWMSAPRKAGAGSIPFTLSLKDFIPEDQSTLTSAFLLLSFWDDGGRYDLFEFAQVSYGYGQRAFEVNTGTLFIPISRKGLAALNEKGELVFTLTRLFGDFTFRSARLAAACAHPSPVPVPGAVWLLGPALIGFLGFRKASSPA